MLIIVKTFLVVSVENRASERIFGLMLLPLDSQSVFLLLLSIILFQVVFTQWKVKP